MSDTMIHMIELSDDELDLIAAGWDGGGGDNNTQVQVGLVNVGLQDTNIAALNGIAIQS